MIASKGDPTMRNRLLALAATIGLIATACGDGPDDDVGPASSGPTEPAASDTETTDTAAPSDETSEPAAAAVDQAAFDEIAKQLVQQFELPAAALQVRVDSQEPTTAVAGVADLDTQQALADTDQLRIYSVTKAVTAVIILQLAEEGVLDLDDPITDWLPPSTIAEVPNNDQMTIRHLLTHSSGAADYFDTIRPGEQQPAFIGELLGQAQTGEFHWYTPQELIEFSTQFEPPFAPGDGTTYSNTGYVMLGLIIEAATGNPVHDEMTARVLEPLGLTSTYLETPDTANDYIPGYLHLGP
ncbi:MAG: serine hydrolase domain-containing protein, partial [Acidimicrobiales bacterium]